MFLCFKFETIVSYWEEYCESVQSWLLSQVWNIKRQNLFIFSTGYWVRVLHLDRLKEGTWLHSFGERSEQFPVTDCFFRLHHEVMWLASTYSLSHCAPLINLINGPHCTCVLNMYSKTWLLTWTRLLIKFASWLHNLYINWSRIWCNS